MKKMFGLRKGCLKKYLGRWAAFLLTGALTTLFLSGCKPDEQTAEKQDETDKISVGITLDSFIIERWQRDRDIFVSKAEELGAEVNVQNANGDIEEQIKQINYFIEKKMDVIVVVQVADDSNTLNDVIEKAQEAGIKVVAYDRLVTNAGVNLYISFDNEMVGYLMGERMVEQLPDGGNILQVCGPLSDNNVSMIMTGFKKAIEGSRLKIVDTFYAEAWRAETAFDVTSATLDKGTHLDGIMCGNDSLAGNAAGALAEARLAGTVCLVGQDADLAACQRIVEGTQSMTVYKPVEQLAGRAAELAVYLAVNGKLPEGIGTINDGSFDVPYEAIEPAAVTKENMDVIITGKYHEKADIYRNMKE